MRVVIGYAGLDPGCEQRLRISGRLLQRQNIDTEIVPWSGARCDILVAASADPGARAAAETCASAAIPVIDLGDDDLRPEFPFRQHLPLRALAHRYVIAIQAALRARIEQGAPSRPEPEEAMPETSSLFDVLSRTGTDTDDVIASLGDLRLRVERRRHRIVVNDPETIAQAASRFCDPGWSLARPGLELVKRGAVTMGLEAFLVRCTNACAERLPPFPNAQYRLRDWPDLGAAPDLVHVLEMVGWLINHPATPQQLVEVTRQSTTAVSAALWGFHMADLLERMPQSRPVLAAAPAASTSHGARRGWGSLLTGLARRFGLSG